jgi:hypothetical protein
MNDIFKIDSDKLKIETILDKSIVHLIIPEGIKSIGFTAFEGCNKLEQVDLPASIAVIGDLQSCPSLRCINVSGDNNYYCSIDGILYKKDGTAICVIPRNINMRVFNIPESVKAIYNWNFYGNKNIESVHIPDSVESVKENAFSSSNIRKINIPKTIEDAEYVRYIPNLEEITIDQDSPYFSISEGILLNKDGSKIICIPIGKDVSHLTLPGSIKEIDQNHFFLSTALQIKDYQYSW